MNQLKLASRISFLLALLALALPGCGDDGDTMPGADAGPGEDAAPATDAGDTVAPSVIATSPTDGASLVSTETAISIAFSEPMDVTTGSLAAATDEGAIDVGEPSWSEDRTRVTFEPTEALPGGATVTVTVGTTFTDLAGNALASSHTFEFTTSDDVPPTIVRTTPAEGATGVDPAIAAIELETSEPMHVASGTARIEGPGEPVLDAVVWTDRIARWAVSGLEAESSYRVVLDGFVDAAGNPLDTSALGAEGALDFTTGADVSAPVVIESTPREGQLDVDVGLVSRVAITFSEPMDESAGTFALETGGDSVELAAEWDRGGRRALLDVAGRLAAAAPHRVVLTGVRDRAGNALDGASYLVDGALDFTTGADLFVPFVAFTSPEEGATDASARLEIVVVFSEAMDPSTTTAPLTGDGRTVTVEGVWSSGNTVLTLSAPTLQAGRSYSLDLTGFRDAGGTPVDATHAYLGDGIATFTLATPTGETCGDALTETEATSVAPGRVEWVVPSGAVTRNDGSASCDPDGHGPDVLVRYRKTTAAARDGGAALRISAVRAGTNDSTRLDVDILAGDCRTGEPLADASRLRCLVERPTWNQWLDVGPGDYFIWVARDGSSTFSGATITVEEVPAIREGESCEAPLTTGSSSAIYTAPSTPGAPHRWVLPAGFPQALDRGRTHGDPAGALSCLPEGSSIGPDAVVTYDKSTDTSLVTVRVTMPAVSSRYGAVEVARGCDPAGADHAEVACLPYAASAIDREVTIDGPAGPISAWLVERRSAPLPAGVWNLSGSPQATIEITEFEPEPGDSCANAIPITPGTTNAVTATRPWRAGVPACLETGGVTWFRYTPTQGLGILRTNGVTTGAVVDRATDTMMRCYAGDDAGPAAGIPVFGVPGEEVCVAISSSASVTQITIEEMPYSGVRGILNRLPMTEGADVTGSFTGAEVWMRPHAGRLWLGGSGRAYHAPIAGGEFSLHLPTFEPSPGVTQALNCRYAAWALPDGLYCLREIGTATAQRLYRIADASGAPLAPAVPVETLPEGFEYVNRRFDALTWDGTQFLTATAASTTSSDHTAVFYAIPADGSAPTEIGRNDAIDDVMAMAVDADYVYLLGRSGTAEALYRLRRDQLTDAAQVPDVLYAGIDLINDGGSLFVDSGSAANYLYFRARGGDLYLVVGPRDDMPRWVGRLFYGSDLNYGGFGYDPSGPSLYAFEVAGNYSDGNWYRFD